MKSYLQPFLEMCSLRGPCVRSQVQFDGSDNAMKPVELFYFYDTEVGAGAYAPPVATASAVPCEQALLPRAVHTNLQALSHVFAASCWCCSADVWAPGVHALGTDCYLRQWASSRVGRLPSQLPSCLMDSLW